MSDDNSPQIGGQQDDNSPGLPSEYKKARLLRPSISPDARYMLFDREVVRRRLPGLTPEQIEATRARLETVLNNAMEAVLRSSVERAMREAHGEDRMEGDGQE